MHKNKIIFFSVIAIIIHSFFLVFSLGVNIPISDEIDFIPFVKTFYDGGPWWKDSHFVQQYDHRLIIYGLIFLASFIFDKINFVNQMYLAVSFLTISTIVLYYLLKRTDNKLTWLSIPITLIIFNAGQSGCYLWGACAISWFLTSTCIILTIFFISKIKTSKKSFIFAIIFSVIASFTILPGLLVWVIGGFGLLFLDKKRKEYLIIWSVTAISVFLIYFTNYTHGSWKGVQIDTLFTFSGIEYILLFLSNGLIVHLHQMYFVQIVVGTVIVIIIITGLVILKLQKIEFNKMIPWIQLGSFGLLGAIITELGRIGVVQAVASRYIAIAAFAQITCLVIGTWIFLNLYKKIESKQKRRFGIIIFLIIMICLTLELGSSYYSGWKIGYDWLNENTVKQECLKDPIFNLKCRNIFDDEKQYENLKILRELQLSLFSEEIVKSNDPLLIDKNWENLKSIEGGIGVIEYINSHPHYFSNDATIPTKISVDRNETPIDIGGWGIFANNGMDVNSVYVFIDEHVNSKAYYGFLNSNNEIYGQKTKPSYFAGIGGIIDLQKLSDGCHTISLRIIHEENYYNISTKSQICVK